MNSNKPLIVKRSTESPVKPQRRSPLVQELVIKPDQQPDIEQPEQPELEVHLESLAETPRDKSVYGSGWSVAELMTEFSGRYDG